jgi:AAHS family 4-hydroxybenzoate transporter-like MFS transporter
MTRARTSVDVDQVIDGARFRGLPLVAALCASAILVLDGFDIQVLGFAAPALLQALDSERAALGPALAASVLGMAIGAAGIGALGDRWGRRSALLISAVVFGVATLATVTATSVGALAFWRLITGVGLGGALPTATALIAEFSPRRFRAQAIGAALIGVPIGGIVGAALAAQLIPAYGWRSVFLVGGALPLIAAVVMLFVLPESPRFLTTRPQSVHALAALLNRLDPTRRYSSNDAFILSADVSLVGGGVRALFSPQLRGDTLMASLAFLANVYAIYAFYGWAPLVLTSMGLTLAAAMGAALVFNLAGVVGSLAISWSISRFGSRPALAVAAAIAIAALGALCWISPGMTGEQNAVARSGLMTAVAVAGAAIAAMQVGLYTLAAHVYPTQVRAAGVGCVLSAGRVGGMASSLVGGLVLGATGAAGFFGLCALMLALAFATVLSVRRHIAGRMSARAAQESVGSAPAADPRP